MTLPDLIGLAAPVALTLLLAWLPQIAGDYINAQARELSDELERGSLDPIKARRASGQAAALARGAVLMSSVASMAIVYVLGCWSAIVTLTHPLPATIIAIVWGLLAVVWLLQVMPMFKLYELEDRSVKNPWPWKNSAFLGFTHATAITGVVTVSGLVVILIAVVAYCQSSKLFQKPPAAPQAAPVASDSASSIPVSSSPSSSGHKSAPKRTDTE